MIVLESARRPRETSANLTVFSNYNNKIIIIINQRPSLRTAKDSADRTAVPVSVRYHLSLVPRLHPLRCIYFSSRAKLKYTGEGGAWGRGYYHLRSSVSSYPVPDTIVVTAHAHK